MPYAGELDQRVSLERKTKVRDGAGGASTTWVSYAEPWAKIRPSKGGQHESADREEARADYIITIRYRTDILESDRIVWGGRAFKITFPKLHPRAQFMDIEATLGGAS